MQDINPSGQGYREVTYYGANEERMTKLNHMEDYERCWGNVILSYGVS